MQAPQRLLPILGQIRATRRRKRAREKAGFPLVPLLLSLLCLLSLPLFNLLLERCGKRILFIDNGVRDALPKFAGLVGQLFVDRGYEFGQGVERV